MINKPNHKTIHTITTNRYKALLFYILLTSITPHCFSQTEVIANDSIKVKAISLSEIAEVASKDIQDIQNLLKEKIQLNTSYQILPELDSIKHKVESLAELSETLLANHEKISFLESLILRWTRIEADLKNPQSELKDYSSSLELIQSGFLKKRKKWEVTQEEIISESLSDDIATRISSVINFLDSAGLILRDSLNVSVSLQNRATDLNITTTGYLKNLNELKQVELGSLIALRENPIWSIQNSSDTLQGKSDNLTLFRFGLEDSEVYFSRHWKTIVFLLVCYLLLFIGFSWLHSLLRKAEVDENESDYKIRKAIMSSPAATAFMFTMLLSLWWLPPRPALFSDIYGLLFIFPFLFVYPKIVPKILKYGLLSLTTILFAILINNYFTSSVVYARISNLIESLFLFIFLLVFLIKRKKVRTEEDRDNLLFRAMNLVVPIYFLIILTAIVSNLLGYNNLTELINYGTALGIIIVLLFTSGYQSLITILFFFFQTETADKSLIIKDKKERIYIWLKKNLRFATFILWLVYALRAFFLWDPVVVAIEEIFNAGYSFGSIYLTIGNVFNFVIIIYLSWLISFILKVLLEVEIFGRLNLPRGVPMAISSLTQYFLIFLGFMMAMAAAGFDLKNLSLLAGALGVGIGFGLQNIVNNFISGLILAFERPVTVGDIVNVAGHEGEVQKIGIRASTIKQWDGSEVIVPNAELISSKVVNWTLAKYTRRLIIIIHTHLNTDTDKVLQLMKEAANKVEFVLHEPEAKSYFQGVKEKHLEFALFYWASGNILDCKSLVNQEVEKALRNAGVQFVMPLPVELTTSAEIDKNPPKQSD